MAAEPSPTAEATRFIDPERRSPTANRPGWLVSNGSGGRPRASHSGPRSPGSRARSVLTKPAWSCAAQPESQPLLGVAPMKEKRAEQASSSSPWAVVTVMAFSSCAAGEAGDLACPSAR